MPGNTTWIMLGAIALAIAAGLVAAGLEESPTTAINPTADTTARVEAPFTKVERDRNSTRVQAPASKSTSPATASELF